MQLTTYFDRVWYVHSNEKFDTMWTTRKEARDRKTALRSRGDKNVTVSYVPLTVGNIARDMHS